MSIDEIVKKMATLDLDEITNQNLKRSFFSDFAEEIAKEINDKNSNKTTQIRMFYDELVRFNDIVQSAENPDEEFSKQEPFIMMLKAKAAYAKGRKVNGKALIDDKFFRFYKSCINGIKDPKTLRTGKLLMEAVMGYRKALEE